jgi:hypothetical protein
VQALLAAAGGLAIGLALGLLGGGGSTLTVPLLLALGVAPKPAIALSLGVVAVTALVALASHARARNVDWRAAGVLLPATTLGGYAGGRAAAFFSGEALIVGFALLMAVAGAAMLWPRREAEPEGALRRPALLAISGAGIGCVTGLVGVGGGFLFVPALVFAGRLAMRRAVGTSLVAIAGNATAALLGHLGHVELPLALGALVTAAALAGAWLGARLAGRVPERALRRSFGVLVIGVAAWLVWARLSAP